MTQSTSSQLLAAPPNREFEWVVEMPQEIAEMFGVPADLPVTLHAQPGCISARMNLTEQTAEARTREPGWFIKLPSEAASISGFAADSFIGIYAKAGAPYVEIIPPPTPEFRQILDYVLEKNREAFEEMKRLGD